MLTPIPTEYAGVTFRSRLEARWAVFFDRLGVRWLYEPEGFELPSGARYLPDFFLPDHDVWVEVKPYDAWPDDPRLREFSSLLSGNWHHLWSESKGQRLALVFPEPCDTSSCGVFKLACHIIDSSRGLIDWPNISRAEDVARKHRFW